MAAKWKSYKRVVDNKMRWHGDIDFDKKIIRVNLSNKKNKKPGEKLDTLLHEMDHADHPKKHEKTVRRDVKRKIDRMSRSQKQKVYSAFA
jgi:hypothetical protein